MRGAGPPPGRGPVRRGTRLARYRACFSRIRVGSPKATPALIQVDCRESSPFASVRRISRACAMVGNGDLIELLTSDLAAVIAALSWCAERGGRVERMESESGAYVLDITPARLRGSQSAHTKEATFSGGHFDPRLPQRG